MLFSIAAFAAEDSKKESKDSTSKAKLTDYQKIFDKKKVETKKGLIKSGRGLCRERV